MEMYETEARKKAILTAKQKANDYTGALGQKLGKVLLITDNSTAYYPHPVMFKGARAEAMDAGAPRETLAIGEIEITANVNVTFVLE